jgi:MATE family multidrug resistance protein
VYRKELKTLTALAAPIIATQLSQMGMSVADTMMAGRVSAMDLAGVALGGNLYWPSMLFLSGVIMSVTPSVSQLDGAGQGHASGIVVRQALWIAVIGGSIVMLLLQNAATIYQAIGVDPLAIPIATNYLNAASFGLVPLLCYVSLRYLCEGLSWTRPAMLIAFSALLLKLPLNYWFIYGGFGVSAMGGEGCGWASAIVMWYQLVAMAFVVRHSRIARSGVFSKFDWPHWPTLKRLLGIGLPIGAGMFFEMAMFSVITLLIGRLGYEAVAAHQIAANVGGITFMVPLALGMAATIRVGVNVGAGDHAAAARSGRVALGASIGIALFTAAAVLLANDHIAALYTNENSVSSMAAGLLLLVAMYQLFDNVQATGIGALRGYKDTSTPMFIALFSYWVVGLPIAAVLGLGNNTLNIEPMGVYGFWWGLAIGLAVAAVIITLRFVLVSRSPQHINKLALR